MLSRTALERSRQGALPQGHKREGARRSRPLPAASIEAGYWLVAVMAVSLVTLSVSESTAGQRAWPSSTVTLTLVSAQ